MTCIHSENGIIGSGMDAPTVSSTSCASALRSRRAPTTSTFDTSLGCLGRRCFSMTPTY
ncbi:uncharacterized protein TRAVEDRAFT_72063 [Trametes versicolor FP-101664 SS1]|uniref:uncharacterized protein n=1 Tax=Trametes versicolor (strain FP-101664) TaxID=717944 RepID=UPI000462417C|nr:uncharacterized protein TRAVEDRAFT_72063 [Trametes versicolor FP-101664 SS1]EIW58517.1 hypothetical protein TRAVEDRAFT_72063 [Trametes versicolor FP-101664 SS1]